MIDQRPGPGEYPRAILPAPERFARYPASWYVFGDQREVQERPVSRELLGRRLVAFRNDRGTVSVLDASCSHLGVDLGRGCVVNGHLRCPFHQWEYGSDGECLRIPGLKKIPEFARQTCYPVEERHGCLFVFNGNVPLFPFPFFQDVRPEDLDAGQPFGLVASAPWYMVAANGFDEVHFRTVHDRALLAPPEVDCPSPFGRRIRYKARVIGDSFRDRLVRRAAGPVVEVTIMNWGGTLHLVTARFRRACSRMLIATQPLTRETTLVETIVFAPRGMAVLQLVGLWLRRWLSRGFLRSDIDQLSGVRYRPHALLETDRMMTEHLAWIASLPQQCSGPDPAIRSPNALRIDATEMDQDRPEGQFIIPL